MALASGVGLISGLNFDDIISRVSAVNQRPIFNLMDRQSRDQQKIGAYTAINAKLVALNDALAALKDTANFETVRASSSDDTTLNVSASNGAVDANYNVTVTQLAQSERRAAQGVDDLETVIASSDGTLSFQIGDGDTVDIDVDAAMTLQQLRDAIVEADAGLNANIVNDGSDTDPYRLVLSVDDTGADNALTILTNDTTLSFETSVGTAEEDAGNTFAGTVTTSGTYTGTGTSQYVVEVTTGGAIDTAAFKVSTDGGLTWGADDEFTSSGTAVDIGEGVEIAFGGGGTFAAGDTFTIEAFDPMLQVAQDAFMEVDGISVQRSSNTFNDVIENVTLTAEAVDADPVNISINVDDQNVTGPINQLALAYNDLVSTIDMFTGYDTDTNQGGVLFGDSTVGAIRRQIVSVITSPVPGMTSDRINTLSQAGISLTRQGTLSVDNAKLRDAIAADFDDIKALFAVTGTTENANLSLYDASGAALQGGTFYVDVTTPGERAEVTGTNVIDPGGLTADESLTFTVDDINFSAVLSAGDTLADIVEKINETMAEEGVAIDAYETSDGELGLRTTEYGSAESITVISDIDGSGQTGIGTTEQSDTGVDVAGTINSMYASGTGRVLSGTVGLANEGLQIEVLATTAGDAGSIEVSFGVAERLSKTLSTLTSSEDGLIKVRTDGLTSSIEGTNERITTLQQRIDNEGERMRAQFRAMEAQLAAFQSQSQFLASSLANIASIRL